MNTIREHIILKFAIVFLAAALLTPYAVKLSHVFANHEHEVCVSNLTQHFHKVDLDCDFYKFKKTNEIHFNLYHYDLKLTIAVQKSIDFYSVLVNNHQQSSIYLRGPPEILV